mgnify:CR=1 FL=1
MLRLRVATYNIHKGVQGVGTARRLEIHNLGHAVEQFDADLVCLQEVRLHHRLQARRFRRWPHEGQAEYLAPEGYEAVYRTNAITRHGEHGNALLSRWPVLSHRHHNISDHRFEQRGLLHVKVNVTAQNQPQVVHVLVVHLGLIPASRERQVQQLKRYILREVPHTGAYLATFGRGPALERAAEMAPASRSEPTRTGQRSITSARLPALTISAKSPCRA